MFTLPKFFIKTEDKEGYKPEYRLHLQAEGGHVHTPQKERRANRIMTDGLFIWPDTNLVIATNYSHQFHYGRAITRAGRGDT
jgi:hypothetical protein